MVPVWRVTFEQVPVRVAWLRRGSSMPFMKIAKQAQTICLALSLMSTSPNALKRSA
jgi:hypothetical protein